MAAKNIKTAGLGGDERVPISGVASDPMPG
jgi:hypothetical protein